MARLTAQQSATLHDDLLRRMQNHPGEFQTASEWRYNFQDFSTAQVKRALEWHVNHNGHIVKSHKVGNRWYYGCE